MSHHAIGRKYLIARDFGVNEDLKIPFFKLFQAAFNLIFIGNREELKGFAHDWIYRFQLHCLHQFCVLYFIVEI